MSAVQIIRIPIENQITTKYEYIENCPNIDFSGIISDTK